jgi:2-iminobutanoate/2-iminopropanoate deaminase
MVYVSAVGPLDPETGQIVHGGIKAHTRRCLENLKAKLEAEGSSLERVAWVTWSLRDASEFDAFNEVWVKWFPADGPVGQGMLMPPLQRRAGFRVSIGAIAVADGAGAEDDGAGTPAGLDGPGADSAE